MAVKNRMTAGAGWDPSLDSCSETSFTDFGFYPVIANVSVNAGSASIFLYKQFWPHGSPENGLVEPLKPAKHTWRTAV